MRNEKGAGVIAFIVIVLVILFFIFSLSGGSSNSSKSSNSSTYKSQYQKDIEHTANVYDMKPSDVDAKVKAVEKALKNK